MTSARDLLLQADALMRSNRSVGAADAETIPMLTDVAVPGGSGTSINQRHAAIPVLTNAVDVPGGLAAELRGNSTAQPLVSPSMLGANSSFDASRITPTTMRYPLDSDTLRYADALHLDVPEDPPPLFLRMRTDALQPPADHLAGPPLLAAEEMLPPMDDFPPMEPPPAPKSPRAYEWPAEPPAILFTPTGVALTEPGAIEAARTQVAATPPAPTEGPGREFPPAERVETAATQTSAQSTAELAESVYYQVLQNLDLFTEKALQRELTAHLAPIIERANRELLATLHANLGGLLRQFIAEAIEKQLGVRPDSGDLSQ